jgi:isopenicillin N synthase-like dioxygenase
LVPSDVIQAARDIIDKGYALVALDDQGAACLAEALDQARAFFRQPSDVKLSHSSDDRNYGYRPFGVEYSITPDRPDVNECFTLWSDRLDLIPAADEILPLTDSFLAWRDVLVPLVHDTLTEVARHYSSDVCPDFEAASYLQINYCLPAPPERDLLQDKHEDGHMVTVLHATAPGLEAYIEQDEATPVLPAANEVLIMPGSVLTALTGGKVTPLYHQVRNHGLDDRQSLMYFVNPEIKKPLFAWVESGEGARADIREHVQNAPTAFGLPRVEEL